LFDTVVSALLSESRVQPLVLLLDDLQWADGPSLSLLDFLVRRLPAGALAVLGAYRDDAAVPLPLSARVDEVRLTGLDMGAVERLIASVLGDRRAAGLAAEVHQRTGGNPFLVQQVSWLLDRDGVGVPPAARQVLEQRLARLPAAAHLREHAYERLAPEERGPVAPRRGRRVGAPPSRGA
jgi:predicted ATPase